MQFFPDVTGIVFDPPTVWLIFISFFVGGLCKGAIGFGLPIVGISFLSIFLPIDFALPLNIIPPLFLNIWQATYKASVVSNFKRFWLVFLGFGVGVSIASALIVNLPTNLILGMVGAVILLFCVNSVWGFAFTIPERREKPYGLLTGVLCGLMGGMTTVSVPPLIAYLTGLRLLKDEFVSVLGLYFFIASLILIISYGRVGLLDWSFLPLGLACTAVTAVGMRFGQLIRKRLDQKKFYNAVLAVLALISLNLLYRAIF